MFKIIILALLLSTINLNIFRFKNEKIEIINCIDEIDCRSKVRVTIEFKDNFRCNHENIDENIFLVHRNEIKQFWKENNFKMEKKLNLSNYEDSDISYFTPFMTYYYSNYDNFVSSDFAKIKKFNKEIKKIYISKEYQNCDNAAINDDTYMNYHVYEFQDALADVGIFPNNIYTGSGVKVGTIESGIPNNDINLQNTVWHAFGNTSTLHCFQVVSILGGSSGIASGAELFFAKQNANNIEQILDWFINNEVNVVNVSTGNTLLYNSNDAMFDYVSKNYGITFVAATGNNGHLGVNSLALGANVISVGEIDSNKSVSIESGFLNPTGGSTYDYSNILFKPTVVAPGGNLKGIPNISRDVQINGTSFAAPFVTGIVALLMEEFPNLKTNPQKVMSLITSSCQYINSQTSQGDYNAGFGLVNYEKARSSYYNIFEGVIAEDQDENELFLFEDNITIPSDYEISISAFNQFNSSSNIGTENAMDFLNFSKISVYLFKDGYCVKSGSSRSNFSFLKYKNTGPTSSNFSIKVFLDGAKRRNDAEKVSVCYSLEDVHVHNYQYSVVDSIQHRCFCTCGDSYLENHHFVMAQIFRNRNDINYIPRYVCYYCNYVSNEPIFQ